MLPEFFRRSFHIFFRMDILGELPIEVAEVILNFLNPNDLITCSGVSRRWRELVNNERTWSRALPYGSCFPPASYVTDCDSEDMEVSPTMRKYLENKLAMKRLKEGNHIRELIKYRNEPHLLRPNCIWMPSLRSFDIGHEVELSHPLEHPRFRSTASEDNLYLACSFRNIIYIYTRTTSSSKLFHLLEILAFKNNMECVIWREESNQESHTAFFNKHLIKYCIIECKVFSGTGNERIICFKKFNTHEILIWNVSSSRLVTHFKYNDRCGVSMQAGWDGHGLCITFSDAIKCYDSEGRLTDTFDLPKGYQVFDTMLMRSFSIVFAVLGKEDDIEMGKVMEFRRDESSVRVEFDTETCTLYDISLVGGPAYPVALIFTHCEKCSKVHLTSLYFGLLSTSGVSSWHLYNFPCSPDAPTPKSCYFFQFVDTTSYLLVSFLSDEYRILHIYQLYRVIMSDTEKGKEVKLEPVPDLKFQMDDERNFQRITLVEEKGRSLLV